MEPVHINAFHQKFMKRFLRLYVVACTHIGPHKCEWRDRKNVLEMHVNSFFDPFWTIAGLFFLLQINDMLDSLEEKKQKQKTKPRTKTASEILQKCAPKTNIPWITLHSCECGPVLASFSSVENTSVGFVQQQ